MLLRVVLILLSLWQFAGVQAQAPTLLSLNGYLGKEELTKARQALEQLQGDEIVIELDSLSGDFSQVFDLAKIIYQLKEERKVKVVVYMNDSAIGPAAILPFLADDLYCSLFVTWGEIPIGAENLPPTNILRNRVISLISPENPHAETMKNLAAAMTDPSVHVVEGKGGKIVPSESSSVQPTGSATGETLVLNQHQLAEMGLIKEAVAPEKFRKLLNLKAIEIVTPGKETAVAEASLESQLSAHIKYSPVDVNKVGWITIDDRTNGINQSTWLYVKTALDYYKQKKPIFVVLELNTPGGEVFSAQQISDALKDLDTQYNIPVVAFINNWAISAGAMLAYSCRFIAVVKDAAMGAAEPLTIGEGGKTEVASEKVNSALRTDFANRAAFFGRDPMIAESMVDKDIILVLRHGKVVKLDNEDQIRKTGSEPDVIISPKGKLLTLTSEQLIQYGVANILLLPHKLEAITPQEAEKGEWPASKTLLFTYPFFEKIPHAVIDVYRMDWKTRFFVWLANPVVSSLLFLGLIISFYIELNTPGFGLAATVGIMCLFLIILSSFALEIANWLELILLLTGIAIIFTELFILPTFGLLGFIGIIMFIVGLFGMMLPGAGAVDFEFDTRTLNAAGEVFFQRLAWLCGTLVVAFGIILLLSRYVAPSFAGFSRFVLKGNEQEGYKAVDEASTLPKPGSKGEVISTLRPSGKVMVEGQIYDALTAGGFIEKGETVVVQGTEGGAIVVARSRVEG